MTDSSSLIFLAAMVFSSISAGVVWFLQLNHYPLYRAVPKHALADYIQAHNRRLLLPYSAHRVGRGGRSERQEDPVVVSLPNADAFAVAGIWRTSDEWGDCYSMVMTDAAGEAADIHDRMPVVLEGEARETWQKGSQEDARALCTGYTGDVVIEKTEQLWVGR